MNRLYQDLFKDVKDDRMRFRSMSLHLQTDHVVPAETAKVAKAIFPRATSASTADTLSSFLCDQDFSTLLSS